MIRLQNYAKLSSETSAQYINGISGSGYFRVDQRCTTVFWARMLVGLSLTRCCRSFSSSCCPCGSFGQPLSCCSGVSSGLSPDRCEQHAGLDVGTVKSTNSFHAGNAQKSCCYMSQMCFTLCLLQELLTTSFGLKKLASVMSTRRSFAFSIFRW